MQRQKPTRTLRSSKPEGGPLRHRTPRPYPPPPWLPIPCQRHLQSFAQICKVPLHPLTLCVDAELWELLLALLTKTDIETLIGSLEESHCQELQAVRSDVQCLSDRLSAGETTLTTLEKCMTALESLQDSHVDAKVNLQLHLEN